MNTDKIKGSIKETAGKAQQEVGEATGSTKQQVKGIEKQVEGKTDKAIGNAKDAVDDDKE
ncbi:MAG TPA: CsbD family protein [Oxalicibacterium sp.]|nr:CsbD family protein [Oxalicibacterium sp.]